MTIYKIDYYINFNLDWLNDNSKVNEFYALKTFDIKQLLRARLEDSNYDNVNYNETIKLIKPDIVELLNKYNIKISGLIDRKKEISNIIAFIKKLFDNNRIKKEINTNIRIYLPNSELIKNEIVKLLNLVNKDCANDDFYESKDDNLLNLMDSLSQIIILFDNELLKIMNIDIINTVELFTYSNKRKKTYHRDVCSKVNNYFFNLIELLDYYIDIQNLIKN